MSRNKHTVPGGFTLVEMMIVVAIIALLAAIALPAYQRARKRSQATAILNDARVLDSAKDEYSMESTSLGSSTVSPGMLTAFLKPNTRLYVACFNGSVPTDILGNSYSLGTFDSVVRVHPNTEINFSDAIDNATLFWGSYYQ